MTPPDTHTDHHGDLEPDQKVKRSPVRTATGLGFACVAALGLSSGLALAATAGDLDSSFGGDGKLVLPLSIRPAEVLVQPDGKVVVADEESFSLVRPTARH